MTSDLPAGDVIVLHDGNGRHAYHALTLAMVALDALSTDQSSRALGCAQGARYGCPKAAASSLEQIVSTKAPFFTHPKDFRCYLFCALRAPGPLPGRSSYIHVSHHSSGRRLSHPPPLVKARPCKDLVSLDSPPMTRSRRKWARAGLPSAAAASEALPSAVPAPDPAPPAGPPRSSLLHVDCEKNVTHRQRWRTERERG